jgi:transcription initiation factor IIE alpha subunit
MLDPMHTPAISAGCGKCGFVYAFHKVFDCPRCGGNFITFATLTEYLPCDTLDEGELADVRWLEEHIANAKEETNASDR